MNGDVKQKAITGLLWKYAERMLAQLVSTAVSIVLARLLEPKHYGIIGIVNIFITLCNVFVVTGLGESLIQKKDADELDFSSIFYVNLFLSVILYGILFLSAPIISNFYDNKYTELVSLIRVMGIRLIFASVNSVQSAKVSRDMSFRQYFWVTLIGTVISAVVGITMAYCGFGVWALAAQYMTNSIIDTIMLFVFIDWHPRLIFSLRRVKPLTKYGWKVLAAALAGTLYGELRSLLIGKAYSSEDLAFYSKGGTYPKLIVNNLNSAISSVVFPVFSQAQDDKPMIKRMMKKALKMSSFLVFPAMIGLAAISYNFILVLLTEKWLPSVPYLQIMCIIYALSSVFGFNYQCMTALGYSGDYLKVTVVEYGIGLLLLFLVFKHGVLWISLSQLISTVFNCFLGAYIGGGKVKYSVFEEMMDIFPNLINALIMGIIVSLAGTIPFGNTLIKLIIQLLSGIFVYILVALLTKNESLLFIRKIAKEKMGK